MRLATWWSIWRDRDSQHMQNECWWEKDLNAQRKPVTIYSKSQYNALRPESIERSNMGTKEKGGGLQNICPHTTHTTYIHHTPRPWTYSPHSCPLILRTCTQTPYMLYTCMHAMCIHTHTLTIYYIHPPQHTYTQTTHTLALQQWHHWSTLFLKIALFKKKLNTNTMVFHVHFFQM